MRAKLNSMSTLKIATQFFDCLILCRFYRDLYPWDEMKTLIQALTGLEGTQETLVKIAGRIATLIRQFNLREGQDPAADRLPERLYKEPLTTGQAISSADLNYMLQDYYRLRGWDSRGVPVLKVKHGIAGLSNFVR